MRAAKQSGGGRSRLRWTTLYALLLAAYSVFALLDAFVIPKDIVYAEEIAGVQEGEALSETAGQASDGDGFDPGNEKRYPVTRPDTVRIF